MAKELTKTIKKIEKDLSDLNAQLLLYKENEPAIIRQSREKTLLRFTRLLDKLSSAHASCQNRQFDSLISSLEDITQEILTLKDRFRLSSLQKKALKPIEEQALKLTILKGELESLLHPSLKKLEKISAHFILLEKNLKSLIGRFEKDTKKADLITSLQQFSAQVEEVKKSLLTNLTSSKKKVIIQQFSSLSTQFNRIHFYFLDELSGLTKTDSYQNLLKSWNSLVDSIIPFLEEFNKELTSPGIVLHKKSLGAEGVEARF